MSPINLDKADLGFAQEVIEAGADGIRRCYGCGACSAFCPILPHQSEYDPRRLIRLILLGQRETVLQSPTIWHCATCYSCQEVCPQKVGFTEIGFVLKNMAVEAGYLPQGLTAQVGLLTNHGRLYQVGEFENEKRTKLGLPEVSEQPGDYQTILAPLAGRLKSGAKEEGDE